MPRRYKRSRSWSSRSRRGRILYRARRRRLSRWSRSIKRRYRTRFKRSKISNTIPRTQLVSLPLCRQIVIPNRNSTVAVAGQPTNGMYVMQMNDLINPLLVDPSVTTGVQPRGRDQWYQFYNNYCVIGADIKIEPLFMMPPLGQEATQNTLIPFSNNVDLVAWYDTDDAAAPDSNDKTFENIIESGNKYVRVTRCTAVPSAVPLAGPAPPGTTGIIPSGHSNFINLKEKKFMKLKYITKKFFDVGKAKMIQSMPRSVAPQNYETSVGIAEEGFLRCSAQRDDSPIMKAFLKMACFHSQVPQPGSSPPTPFNLPTALVARLTVRFKVVWFNPLTLVDS